MQLFSADAIVLSKKLKKKITPKTSSKVAHYPPPTFFFSTGPAAQMAQNQKLVSLNVGLVI